MNVGKLKEKMSRCNGDDGEGSSYLAKRVGGKNYEQWG